MATTTTAEQGYDVFLSHRSLDKPWVEVLARNLIQAGFTVFYDAWNLIPGQPHCNAPGSAVLSRYNT